MTPVGLEPTISAGERPQTYALGHTVNGTGYMKQPLNYNNRIIYMYTSVSTLTVSLTLQDRETAYI